MILLGLTPEEKRRAILDYAQRHEIQHIVMLAPAKFAFPAPVTETVDWPEIIMYRTFYRLLQEIGPQSLVVVNECLRTQNRYDLTYNCIRHFLNQAGHQLIFQWLPLIETLEDFMILFDFDTGSRWKRERFDPDLLAECTLQMTQRPPQLSAIPCPTDAKLRTDYQREKQKLLDGIGNKDPHTIPRNLYLMSGKARMQRIDAFAGWSIGRNNRFKMERWRTYKEATYPEATYPEAPYTVFEFPHNFIDFADFMALSQQTELPVLVADLPVDQWYMTRYQQWAQRIEDGYASLS